MAREPFGMKNQKILSGNDREHLKFFVREFLYPNIDFEMENDCWFYSSPRFGEYMRNIDGRHVLSLTMLRRKFGTSSIQEILWMFVNRRTLAGKFFIKCAHSVWCVNPAHATVIDPKMNDLYPVPADGALKSTKFCKKFVHPWIEKDSFDHWIFRSPLTRVPLRLFPKELKIIEYANKDIQEMLWENETGKKLDSASNFCQKYFCVNPNHFTGMMRFRG